MAKIENCAVITADFPDDAVETDDGNDFLIWPGRNIAEALCEILRGLGYAVEGPEHEGEHGWTFWSKASDGRRAWFQVTDIEEYLLVIEDDGGRRGEPASASYTSLLARLGAALNADKRFKSVRWSTLDDIRLSPEKVEFDLLDRRSDEARDTSTVLGVGGAAADGVLRTCAIISVDDSGHHEDRDYALYPVWIGGLIFRAFRQILSDLEYEPSPQVFWEKPEWSLRLTATTDTKCRVRFQLTFKDGFLLTTKNIGRVGVLHKFSRRRRAVDSASYCDLLKKFSAALASYSRFKSVRWCTEEEIGVQRLTPRRARYPARALSGSGPRR